MMANRYRPSTIDKISEKKIFFDANVLIYLFGFGTPTKINWGEQYARLYSRLNTQKNKFVIDYIILSEFVNRAIRFEYDNFLVTNGISKRDLYYKNYRNSDDGQEALNDIYLTVKYDILSDFEVVEKSYSKDDLTLMCSIDSLDFSDKAIVQICDENQFVLLTNDTDFKDEDIDILSCHRNIW